MINATTNEKIKAAPFRRSVAFLPKYFISTGIVTTPTIISVDTKAAICIYPAPFSSKSAAVGNATNPGIMEADYEIIEECSLE